MSELYQESVNNSIAFIRLDKELIKFVGLHPAVLYCELLSKKKYFEDKGQLTNEGYFYNTIDNLLDGTGLSKYQQRESIKKLEEIGLIKVKIKGVPARRYFYITEILNYSQLSNNLTTSSSISEQQDIQKLDDKKLKNSTEIRTINKKKNKNNLPFVDGGEIVNIYNSICVNLPKCSHLDRTRKKKLDEKLSEYPNIDWWEEVFKKLNTVEFSNFKPDLSWVLKDDNALRVYEGVFQKKQTKYNNQNTEDYIDYEKFSR